MVRLAIFIVFLTISHAVLGAEEGIVRFRTACPFQIGHWTEGYQSVGRLLYRYRSQPKPAIKASRLRFRGIGSSDAYNPTAPFFIGGRTVLAARVESHASETDSRVMFFEKHLGIWSPVKGAPVFDLQDPFHAQLGSEHIIGGVEVYPDKNGGLGYRTVFYRGRNLATLHRFAEGPDGMKDIRLAKMADGRIAVFTRPQCYVEVLGTDCGPGRIGFTILNSLDELIPKTILSAPLIEWPLGRDEWGGVSEVLPQPDGKLRVLIHVARYHQRKNKQYFPAVFTFDPIRKESSPIKIILERRDLPGGLRGRSKNPNLRNVVFGGGMVRHKKGWEKLYLGAGDAEAYVVEIPDSFLE